jgi:hypothetical protein
MRTTTLFASLAVLFTLALTACGEEKDKEGLTKDCPAAPAAMTGSHTLPGSFPAPAAMVFTGVKKDGPLDDRERLSRR